jgi:hypothetical protein
MKTTWNPASRPQPVSRVWETCVELAVMDANPDTPMGRARQSAIALHYRAAFDAMRSGRGDEDQWSMVVLGLNKALILSEMGYGPEWEARINAALEGAFRAKLRGDKTGKWGFDGPALSAIAEALEVHEAQLEAATQAEILEARDKLKRRIEAGIVFTAEQDHN